MGGGASALDPDKVPDKYVPDGGFNEEPFHVFLDIQVDGEKAGRMVVNLRADVCPMACENFRLLCTGEKGHGYKGAAIHLHVPAQQRVPASIAPSTRSTVACSITPAPLPSTPRRFWPTPACA